MSTSTFVGQSADQHVFLVGRPPMGEYLGFVTTHTVGGDQTDVAGLAQQWRDANDHVQMLEQTEPGVADDAPVLDLPPELAACGAATIADPDTQRAFAVVPFTIGIVELDRLVVWQKKINLSHVARLAARLEPVPEDDALYRFCLPSRDQRDDPPIQMGPVGPNAWGFVSPSNDFRLLGHTLLDPASIPAAADRINGIPHTIIAIGIGYGINLLAAIRVNGRLILNNGSHRAYALRQAGITHVPCLVQNVTRRDELDTIAGVDLAAKCRRLHRGASAAAPEGLLRRAASSDRASPAPRSAGANCVSERGYRRSGAGGVGRSSIADSACRSRSGWCSYGTSRAASASSASQSRSRTESRRWGSWGESTIIASRASAPLLSIPR